MTCSSKDSRGWKIFFPTLTDFCCLFVSLPPALLTNSPAENSATMQNTCLQNTFSKKHFLREEEIAWRPTVIVVSECNIVLNTTAKF
jgi:hypothetical protein